MRHLITLLAVAVFGIAVVLADVGCEILNESPPPELMWLAGQGYRNAAADTPNLQQARALSGLGSTLEFSAQSEANKQAAREGRSDIQQNAYVPRSNDIVSYDQEIFRNIHPLRRPEDVIFVSSGYKGDLNNNGRKDYPDEFKDIGQGIFQGTDVFIYVSNSINRNHAVVFEILKGRHIVNRVSIKMSAVQKGVTGFAELKLDTSRASLGMHNVRCFIDGQYWGETEFNLKTLGKATLRRR